MFAETTRGSNSPIYVETHGKDRGDRSDHAMMVLAVMIILVIFIFVIFAIFAMRKDGRQVGGGLAEVAAAGLIANQSKGEYAGYGYQHHLMHDNNRDMLKGFGEIEKEIALTHANSQAHTAQYFYQTQRDIELAKFENYKVTVEQAEKTRAEMAMIERDRRNDEMAREREANLKHGIIAALHPHHHFSPQPVIKQQHIVAENGGFGHGY